LKYPSSIRVVKLPCTGRVNPLLLLKALEDGADGVYVVGCKEGDCHYLDGNIKAKKIVRYTKGVLQSIGIDPGRVEMYNLSASDGPLFAQFAREFNDRITGLGPIYGQGAGINEAG
jgi:coenzyme F420-reducing hydrogenase delta subunit